MSQQPTIDQAQQTLPMLTDYHAGFEEGMHAFQDGIFFPEDNKVWSEEDIIQFVETELSGTKYRRMKRYDELKGNPTFSYTHNLGFVAGYVQAAVGIMVTCHTCKRPVLRTDVRPMELVEPSGRFRNGREILRATGQTVYECDSCQNAYFQTLA